MNVHSTDKASVKGCMAVDDIIEKRLEEIVTILSCKREGKSTLYDEVLSMVERILICIALRESGNVKKSAAQFLGINRNTLHSKMNKLGIEGSKDNR